MVVLNVYQPVLISFSKLKSNGSSGYFFSQIHFVSSLQIKLNFKLLEIQGASRPSF